MKAVDELVAHYHTKVLLPEVGPEVAQRLQEVLYSCLSNYAVKRIPQPKLQAPLDFGSRKTLEEIGGPFSVDALPDHIGDIKFERSRSTPNGPETCRILIGSQYHGCTTNTTYAKTLVYLLNQVNEVVTPADICADARVDISTAQIQLGHVHHLVNLFSKAFAVEKIRNPPRYILHTR